MNVMRTLWASIQGDPAFMRRINGWLTVFWVAMIPVSLVTGWISSVTYVGGVVAVGARVGHWSAWQAAHVEVRQDEEASARGKRSRSSSASSRSSSRKRPSNSPLQVTRGPTTECHRPGGPGWAGGAGDQAGSRTLSMTWITPLLAGMSAA